MTGQAMGTLDYMPPEQALDTKTVDGRADIYSLGCTLHYLLTGRPPYRADTLAKKLAVHRTDPIPSLREKRPEVPECLEQVYRRMLAKTPDERQQTMQEVVTQLEECVAAGNLTAEPGCFAETVSFRGEALPGPTAQQSTVLGDVNSLLNAPVDLGSRLASPLSTPPAGRVNRRKPWMVGIGAGIIGFVFLLGLVILMRSKEGTLVVEVNEPDAVVEVLDESGTVEVSGKSGAERVTERGKTGVPAPPSGPSCAGRSDRQLGGEA